MSEVQPDNSKVLLSPDQAADALGCGRTQVYHLIAGGQLRSVKIGRLRRIPVAELHRYVDSLLATTEASA